MIISIRHDSPILFLPLVVMFATGCGNAVIPRFDPGRELVEAAAVSTNAVETALKNGGDVNLKSSTMFGWTPLISAIYRRNEDVVRFLLAQGADVNLTDDMNRTPIMWLVDTWSSNTNLMRVLVLHGADPSIEDEFGNDAFDMASSQPNAAAIRTILQGGDPPTAEPH